MKPRYPESAEPALEIFKRLRVPDMPGQPTMAEVCRPWTFDFVASIFGGKNPDTGAQTIRESFLLIPKKNGKTLIAAGIILTQALLHERHEDELLLLSATKEIANLAFRTIAGMVRADPDLSEIFWVRDNIKTVHHRITGNDIKVASLDANTVAGKRASFVLVDEIWTLGTVAKAESALQEATGGLISRPEGWVMCLSTQSDEPPQGVFRDKLNYARLVASGEVQDKSFLPVMYELPEGFDWQNNIEQAFEITNPNLGASVSREWLQSEYQKVKDKTDGQLQRFVAKHLNVEIGLALRSDRWSGADYWEEREQPLTLDELIERSEVIDVGIDGGGLDDLLGLYVIGRETGRKLGWGHAWCAEVALKRRESIAPTLRGFERDGDLTIVPDIGPDIEELAQLVFRIYRSGKLDQIGCDPAGIGQTLEAIQNTGVPESCLIGVSQGWKLGSAIITAERWLADGSFTPADQSLMRWCVSNARIEQRSNSILVTKQSSGRGKIDPLMALFDATALMAQNPEAKTKKLALLTL